jgi:DNA-directed RNA polymerase subunit RPC12/RpoP
MAIEKCQSCKKPFRVSEHNLPMPGTKEKEPITCPYCSYTIERTSNGWWNTAALSEQEQQDYLSGKLTDFD